MINLNKHIKKIYEIQKDSGISTRKLDINGIDIYILYVIQITNRDSLSRDIIKPILQYNSQKKLTVETILESVIYIDDAYIDNDENNIIDYVIQGKSVIITSNSTEYIVANTLKVEKRSIQSPDIQSTIRSPKDSFNENIDTNISLIRHRIKDDSLKVDNFTVGTRTKTNVAVVYIEDIANSKFVGEIKESISKIKIDGILESGYIQKFISNENTNLFPQIGICERSDIACASILDGKVCIIIDGSNLALLAPQNFIEFLDAGDDHYDNKYFAIFVKVLRFISLITTLTLSSLYVTVVAFHPDILPSQYILAIAASRVSVPVNAALEATIMEIIVEILREANIRLPKQIGPAISIVGTIVIGQAAVSAGLVSPLMVIIVSLSSITSFAVPDYTIMNPIRILKFMLIILSSIFGIIGFIMGLTIILLKITSISSFGVPYSAPIAPFNGNDIKNYILSNPVLSFERPKFLKTKNKKRKEK